MKTAVVLTLTALSALALMSSDFTPPAEAAKIRLNAAPKPKIRLQVVKPSIRVRVDTKRLAKPRHDKANDHETATARKAPAHQPATTRDRPRLKAAPAMAEIPLPREKPHWIEGAQAAWLKHNRGVHYCPTCLPYPHWRHAMMPKLTIGTVDTGAGEVTLPERGRLDVSRHVRSLIRGTGGPAATTDQRNSVIPNFTVTTQTVTLKTVVGFWPEASVSGDILTAALDAGGRRKTAETSSAIAAPGLTIDGNGNSSSRRPGVGAGVAAPEGPMLDLPRGFVDVFRVSGGNFNDALKSAADLDALRGPRAMQDLSSLGASDNALPGGGSAFGRQRLGAGFEGPPAASADAPTNGGIDSSTGWTKQPGGANENRTVWSRDVSTGGDHVGTETFVLETGEDGSHTATATLWIDPHQSSTGPSNEGFVAYTREITVSAPDKNGTRTVTITVRDENGNIESQETSTVNADSATPMPDDQNANGVDDDNEEVEAAGNSNATQPAPQDNATNGSGRGCGLWTVFGGCAKLDPKIWETTAQPQTGEQGTVNVSGSARPNAGAAAVTNSGDGGFIAGSGRGGNGGAGYDPCATVKSAGCSGPGPHQPGPAGSAGGPASG